MTQTRGTKVRALLVGASLIAVAGCDGFDFDLRSRTGGFGTSEAVQGPIPARPAPDGRGVISYPGYQVAVARRGDTIADVAERVGLPTSDLASFNAIDPNAALRNGEIIALPRRVAEPGLAAPLPAPTGGSGGIDVTTLAGSAIARAESGAPAAGAPTPSGTIGSGNDGPVRHQVVRGETAYSISRLYGIPVSALADWNGLGPSLIVREGAYLIIPPAGAPAPAAAAAPVPPVAATPVPGQGAPAPLPPSAATPLPPVDEAPASETPVPPSPNLAEERTAAPPSGSLAMPVQGSIIRAYEKGRNEGIDISAAAGATVSAAEAGTVAAVTRSTENVTIVIVRHDGAKFGSSEPILTVYANLDEVTVERGARVTRGQALGKVRAGSPAFVRFEVRRGFETLDPGDFLK